MSGMLERLSSLAAPSAAKLIERRQSVAVADGSTGGLISAGLSTIPGATRFFRGGGTLYSLRGRSILFGLEPGAFDGLSGVTEPYALLQASSICKHFEVDWGVAESGSAGPAGHPHGADPGVSCIAVVGPGVSLTRMVRTGSTSRVFNMEAFAAAALLLLQEAINQG